MPMRSKAQRRWMHANKPEMAKRWEKHTPKGKLPEKVKKSAAHELGVKMAVDMGHCLMAYPDTASLDRIQKFKKTLDQGDMSSLPSEGTDGPHVTLRYWNSDGPVPKRVKNFIDKFVGAGKSVTTKADDWEIMGKDDTLAMRLTSSRLMEFQEELDKGLQERGVEKSDFPEYKPHVSLFEQATGIPETKPDLKIRFNKWILSTRAKEEMGKSAYELGVELGKQAKERKKCKHDDYWDGERCRHRRHGYGGFGFGRGRRKEGGGGGTGTGPGTGGGTGMGGGGNGGSSGGSASGGAGGGSGL